MLASISMKRRIPKTTTGISISVDLYQKGKEAARREHRTFSSFIESLIYKALKETKTT